MRGSLGSDPSRRCRPGPTSHRERNTSSCIRTLSYTSRLELAKADGAFLGGVGEFLGGVGLVDVHGRRPHETMRVLGLHRVDLL